MSAIEEKSWAAFISRMRRFVSKRISDPDEVDDILQEIFLKMHASLGTMRDSSRLAPWLYRIARNTIIDHYRSRRVHVPVTDDLEYEKEPDDDATARQVASGLEVMMSRLPGKYREALELVELKGLTQRELARRQGLSLAGAKTRVQRGRALLRAELLACCHFEFDRRGGLIDYVPRSRCCPGCKGR